VRLPRRRREPERPLPGLTDRPPLIRPHIIPPDELAPLRDPFGGDVHRPMPAANAWPDEAVLLTYAELRGLVSLHLDLCRECMPNVGPWDWIKERARAMRDGETPLLLSEVMER
jgi:hypothetical protein